MGSPPVHVLWPSGHLWMRSLPVGPLCWEDLLPFTASVTVYDNHFPGTAQGPRVMVPVREATGQLLGRDGRLLPRGGLNSPGGGGPVGSSLQPLFFALSGPGPKGVFLVQSGLPRSLIKHLLCASPVLDPELIAGLCVKSSFSPFWRDPETPGCSILWSVPGFL